jgi:ATP-binding cassette subfamily G (WHITE) protein 2 (PDR)
MSHPTHSGNGIIRTASGRDTYAPDGHFSEPEDNTEHMEAEATLHSSSDSSSSRFVPIKSPNEFDDDSKLTPKLTRRRTEAEIPDEDRRQLEQLYSTLSRRASTLASPGDPSVDPASEQFDLSKFLKLFRNQLENEGVTMRQVGLVYKNLNVYGSGAALQLQKTVTDFLLAPFRVREWFSFGKKDQKHILRNFDGVINSGEMLIVLGRPGSGCSTLLKTMCGELHGLELGDGSVLHYNGIPQKQMMKEFKGEAIYNQEVSKPETIFATRLT